MISLKCCSIITNTFLGCVGSSSVLGECLCRDSVALVPLDCCCDLFLPLMQAPLLSVPIASRPPRPCTLPCPVLGTCKQSVFQPREFTQREPRDVFACTLCECCKACGGKENLAVRDSRAGSPLCEEEGSHWALEQRPPATLFR